MIYLLSYTLTEPTNSSVYTTCIYSIKISFYTVYMKETKRQRIQEKKGSEFFDLFDNESGCKRVYGLFSGLYTQYKKSVMRSSFSYIIL